METFSQLKNLKRKGKLGKWQRWLQPFSQDYGLASHSTHVVFVNFVYMSGGTYSLKSTPIDRFFEKLHEKYIYSQRFFKILLRWSRRIFLFLMSALSNKLTPYLLDSGNYLIIPFLCIFFSYFVLMSDLGFESWPYV